MPRRVKPPIKPPLVNLHHFFRSQQDSEAASAPLAENDNVLGTGTLTTSSSSSQNTMASEHEALLQDTPTSDMTGEELSDGCIDLNYCPDLVIGENDDDDDDGDNASENTHEDNCESADLDEQREVEEDRHEQRFFGTASISENDRYQAAGIKPELATVYRQAFDVRMKETIEYIASKARAFDWNGLETYESWVGKSTHRQMNNANTDDILKLFQDHIPESTRSILGEVPLTEKQLLALPRIGHTRGDMGVYLCYASEVDASGGLYVGSTTRDLKHRMAEHRYNIKKSKRGGNEKVGRFYKYFKECPQREPNFRQVAVFVDDDAENDLSWTVRLLETVIMLMLGSFMAEQANPAYTISAHELHIFRDHLNSQGEEFYPLNAALPTKQLIKGCPGRRVCSDCSIADADTEKKLHWFCDSTDPLATSYLCENCWWYRKRHNEDRPEKLWKEPRFHRPEGGPCSNGNCRVGETKTVWHWHPDRTVLRVLCNACYSWATNHNGEDRPLDIVNKIKKFKTCVDCGVRKADTRHYAESTWRCNKCQDEMDNPQTMSTEIKSAIKCVRCGVESPENWNKNTKMCGRCHKIDNPLRDVQERSDCYNCNVKFNGKKMQRRWAPTLREWLCDACYRTWERQSFLRICTEDLKDLDIRCGTCRTRYSRTWCFGKHEGKDKLRCHRCRMSLKKNSGRTNFQDYSNEEKKEGCMTYFESHSRSSRAISKPEFFAWLKQVHGIDRSRAAVEAAKARDDQKSMGTLL